MSRERADIAGLLANIKSADGETRLRAQQGAGPAGAEAIAPLADIAAASDKGAAKAARGAMETIAHHSARPGAGAEARTVSTELLKIAQSDRPKQVRADALNLLGYTASDGKIVAGISALIANMELRDEARMALERIPGNASLNALKQAAQVAPADFRPHLEQSVRNRALTRQTVGIALK
jgi:hypothetical protein